MARRQIINPGILLGRSAKGPFATRISGGIYARSISTGTVALRPVRGWTDGEDCAATAFEATVRFNKAVLFDNQNGVKFVNTTTQESAGVTSGTGSGTDMVQYQLTWVTAPVLGDVVQFDYESDAPGANYREAEDETRLMGDQVLTLENCADRVVPADPTTLAAATVGPTAINVTWTNNAVNATANELERAPAVGGPYSLLVTLPAGAESHLDLTVSPETEYCYRVRATNQWGNSGYSNNDCATTPAIPTVPDAPTNLVATAASDSQIDLTWTDNANNEDQYRVERKQGTGGTYSVVQILPADSTSYSDTDGLVAETEYCYRVAAQNATGISGYSNEDCATTGATPIVDQTLIGFAPDGNRALKTLLIGAPVPAFARTTVGTVIDADGSVSEAPANELRYMQSRRVHNLLTEAADNLSNPAYSENLQQGWQTGAGASIQNATQWLSSGTTSFVYTRNAVDNTVNNQVYSFRAKVVVSADCALRFVAGGTNGTYRNVFASEGEIVLSDTITVASPGDTWFRLQCNTDGVTVTFTEIQIENVTDKPVQLPGEYVSVRVLDGSDPQYHGAMVDGVRYYAKTSPVQVDNGRLTEDAVTTPLEDYYALFEGARTNLSLGNNDLSGGPETITLSEAGDYVLSVYGTAQVAVAAGTAVGTGFGVATEGNSVQFNITGTGTITLTLNAGALKIFAGSAMKQVEKSAIPTSWIKTTDTPVQRTADDGEDMFTPFNSLDGVQGTIVGDFIHFADSPYPNDATANMSFLAINNSAASLLYCRTQSPTTFRTSDGTVNLNSGNSWVRGKFYRSGQYWDGAITTVGLGFRNRTDGGLWGNWAERINTGSGGYPVNQDKFRVGLAISEAFGIANLNVYNTNKGRTYIEDNY